MNSAREALLLLFSRRTTVHFLSPPHSQLLRFRAGRVKPKTAGGRQREIHQWLSAPARTGSGSPTAEVSGGYADPVRGGSVARRWRRGWRRRRRRWTGRAPGGVVGDAGDGETRRRESGEEGGREMPGGARQRGREPADGDGEAGAGRRRGASELRLFGAVAVLLAARGQWRRRQRQRRTSRAIWRGFELRIAGFMGRRLELRAGGGGWR